MKRKVVCFLIAITTVFNVISFCTMQIFAHSTTLNVGYDDCVDSKLGDSMYEMWYVLDDGVLCNHLSHKTTTIKYFFKNGLGGQSWSDISDAEEIKNAYVNSMKKWNNVYFYSYDSSGNIVKNKVINIIEGTQEDHNLSISPGVSDPQNIAETGSYTGIGVEQGNTSHFHNSDWYMGINISYFSASGDYSEEVVNWVREAVGAHEIGHVLGLKDVDKCCSQSNEEDHHLELLMGYGLPLTNRVQDITYKDIAGVAITRGFHTDDDHQWIKHGLQNDGTYKLVCSICNGVKYVENLEGYSYVTYGSCAGNHFLGMGYMIPVASYGTKDYYKCMYCSYVAPFSSIVEQNYSKTNHSHTHHKCVNDVAGLEYTFYEEHYIVDNECLGCGELIHSYTDHFEQFSSTQHKAYCECGEYITASHEIVGGVCALCGEPHTHDYSDHYVPKTNSTHISYCICGNTSIEPHVVSSGAFSSGNKYAICLVCGGTATTGITLHQAIGDLPRSENGSFILPNGVIVLVDEDIEAYFDGRLEFIYPDDNLETE